MDDQVAQVKQKTDIVTLISEYIELKKAGRNYRAPCPFHSEKTPSFMVSPELQIFKCFGCSEGGDAFSFLQKYENMDFPEALKFLADRAGIKLTQANYRKSGEKEKLYEINNLATKFYRYILLKHSEGKEALSYLTKERGLKLTTIKTFQLGFSPDASDAVKKFLVDKKKFKMQDLVKTGILYSGAGRAVDRFMGRVVFPLFDHRGNTVGFAGRTLPSKEKSLPAGKHIAKYINSPETPVYHKSNLLYGLNLTRSEIKSGGRAIVVEGELDLISSWQIGIKNIVALKGSAFTQDQAKLLSRFTKEVVLTLDTDIAGDMAARRGIAIAEAEGLEVKVARLGNYKDPDDMARKASEKYKKVLASPVGVWDFVIDSIFESQSIKTGSGKAKLSREIVPILASISDTIVQAHYAEIVAKKMGVPTPAVMEQVSKFKKTKDTKFSDIVPIPKTKTKSRRQLLEERLMALAFRSSPEILLEKRFNFLVTTPLTKKILREFRKYLRSTSKFNPLEFAKTLPKELVDGFAVMFLEDTQVVAKDGGSKDPNLNSRGDFLYNSHSTDYEKELELILTELQILEVKLKLKQSAEKIKELEKMSQKIKLEKEGAKFARLTEELVKLRKGRRGLIL